METSAKGDVLAAAKSFGIGNFRITDSFKDPQTVRGTIGFIKYLKQGNAGGIALDGPNGSYHVPKKGVFVIAHRSESEIIPMGIWYARKIIIQNRWDKYQVPLPFSQVALLFDESFSIAGLNEGNTDLYTHKLAQRVDLNPWHSAFRAYQEDVF